MSVNELKRYSRQLIIPKFGPEAQRKLKAASVAVTGAGGIGTPAAAYLAAAGVGEIVIFDSDSVEVSNLNRQFLFTEKDAGKPKAEVLARRLAELNPEIKAEGVRTSLSYENVFSVLDGFDAILDGTDNFAARYAINDAAVKNGIPLFHASALQFEGRALTVIPKKSACLRCFFPVVPKAGAVPACREAGILGPVTGVVASIAAGDCIRHLAGFGASLLNRIVLFDARDFSFSEFKVKQNPKCTACGSAGFKARPVEQDACER